MIRKGSMMRRWWFASLCLGIGCSIGCRKENPPAPSAVTSATTITSASASTSAMAISPKDTTPKELALLVVQWLRAGENAKVSAILDPAMAKALPNDAAVGALWGTLEGKTGKLKKIIETTEKTKDAYQVVLVTCDFEASPMDLRLVFDKEHHLAGVSLQPTQNPNAFGPRPQHPKPPFPYEARDVTFDNEKDKSHFAGTLTFPKGAGPFPAVLLVTGSGSQDRDETIFGHKPFLVIADALTKKGIAVLRVDDPGTGGSTGDVKNADLEVHARDVEAGLAFLGAQKEIDPKRIGIVGHSEGAILAAMVAARSKSASFVVSLAGTGLSGAKINPMQIEAILRADGKIKEEGIQAIVYAQERLMKLIAEGADDKALEDATKQAFATAIKYAPTEEDGKAAQKGIGAGFEMLKSAWFRSFVKLDPAAHWSKVKVPVLAMIGDKDTQVPADPNLAAIKDALAKAANKDVTAEKLAGLNHLFQPATSGLVEEYGKIETTFDPQALETMTSWVAKHTNATP
jgi:uncharacterized protein